MNTPLIIDGTPSNLRLPLGATAMKVSSDLYNICERIKEVHPSLEIVMLDPPQKDIAGRMMSWCVMQLCEDGILRTVFKCEELDDRAIKRMREIVYLPLAQRLDEIERSERKLEADGHAEALEKLYEEMGIPMHKLLEDCGFIQRPKSFPKAGRTAQRYRSQSDSSSA